MDDGGGVDGLNDTAQAYPFFLSLANPPTPQPLYDDYRPIIVEYIYLYTLGI